MIVHANVMVKDESIILPHNQSPPTLITEEFAVKLTHSSTPTTEL